VVVGLDERTVEVVLVSWCVGEAGARGRDSITPRSNGGARAH
jgi:hypothetical protein